MFLADNILIDVINSQFNSVYKNTNNFSSKQHNSCTECENHKAYDNKPFPEAITDSHGNIGSSFGDDNSSSSDSSSDDETGGNNYNSNNQRMIQPSSYNENINTDNYNSVSPTQPQLNGENVYNSLNQRIIEPLQSFSPTVSDDDSDMENLERNQSIQNLNSRSDYSPKINEHRPFDNPTPVNSNQENSNEYIADSTQEEMDINDERDQIRQHDDELGEDQFTAPLPEDNFRNLIVPNITSSRRSDLKMRKNRSKIRNKQYESLQKLRKKKAESNRDQVQYKMRKPIQNVQPGEEQFTTTVPEEEFMDVNVPILPKLKRKEEYDDFEMNENEMKKDKRVFKNPSRMRKQQERKQKIKLLKLKNERLKQLYHENKNQILENENNHKDSMVVEPGEEQFTTPVPDEEFMDIMVPITPKRNDRKNEDSNVDLKSEHTTTSSKRPLRKFASDTLTKPKNESKPQIRVAKFANQELIKDSRNLTNELQYFCELCKIQFPKYSSLRQHLQENHEKKQYKIDFPNAGKYLALARKVKHKNDGNKFFYENFDSNNRDTVDITSYWCPKCQTFFQNFASMQSHMLKEHEEGTTAAKRSITRDKKPQKNKKMFYEPY